MLEDALSLLILTTPRSLVQDFWRLDLKTNAWEAIEEKGGPSPRSGHRMVVWRNYLVVFGGFYEAARETKCVTCLLAICM